MGQRVRQDGICKWPSPGPNLIFICNLRFGGSSVSSTSGAWTRLVTCTRAHARSLRVEMAREISKGQVSRSSCPGPATCKQGRNAHPSPREDMSQRWCQGREGRGQLLLRGPTGILKVSPTLPDHLPSTTCLDQQSQSTGNRVGTEGIYS